MTDAGWNFALLGLFAVQHSGMARRVSRKVFALASYAVLAIAVVLWRPMPDVLWRGWWALWVPGFVLLIWAARRFGVGELLGWREPGSRRVPSGFLRHPLYVAAAWILWAQPVMTEGGLLCATTLTVYLCIGTWFEERAHRIE